MTTTVIDLLGTARTHLSDFELPQPWALTITTGHTDRDIDVQLGYVEDPTQIAAALLAWAATLTEVTAAAWRCYNGDSVHLSITGRLTTGATVRVFDAIAYTGHGPGAELAPGEATSLRPGVLRALATPGRLSTP
jgi:hypothetical protein